MHLALRKIPRAGDNESVGRAPSFGDQQWESETLVCRTCSVFDGWCACNARHYIMSETVPRGSMDFRYHRTHSLGLTFFPSNIWKWELLSYDPAAPLRRGLPICACLGRRLPCTAGAGVENAQMPPRGPRCFLDHPLRCACAPLRTVVVARTEIWVVAVVRACACVCDGLEITKIRSPVSKNSTPSS